MARPSNTESRRQEIIEALAEVMADHGYAKATIAEIAKVAGLAPGLVHYHFDDKREVLMGLIAHLSVRLDARIETRLAQAGADPRERLEAAIDAYLALGSGADARAVATWVAVSVEAIRDKQVRRVFEAALERERKRLEALISPALPDWITTVELRANAAAVLAAIQGYFLLAASAPGTVPKGSAATSVRRMVAGLLGLPLRARAPKRAP